MFDKIADVGAAENAAAAAFRPYFTRRRRRFGGWNPFFGNIIIVPLTDIL